MTNQRHDVSEKAMDVVTRVLAADRPMPAKFNSDGDRRMSFLADFDWISADDEYNLASAAWHQFVSAFHSTLHNVSELEQSAVLRIGEDITLASYVCTKEEYSDDLNKVQQLIVDGNLGRFKEKVELVANGVIALDFIRAYWDRCKQDGISIAQP